jgi:aminoglycoside phosphotransferase family enzyme
VLSVCPLADLLSVGRHRLPQNLVSLVKVLEEFGAANEGHGDICNRNVCLGELSLQLVDLGEIAQRYENDVVATVTSSFCAADRMSLKDETRAAISKAARVLIQREDVDVALVILEGCLQNALRKTVFTLCLKP